MAYTNEEIKVDENRKWNGKIKERKWEIDWLRVATEGRWEKGENNGKAVNVIGSEEGEMEEIREEMWVIVVKKSHWTKKSVFLFFLLSAKSRLPTFTYFTCIRWSI